MHRSIHEIAADFANEGIVVLDVCRSDSGEAVDFPVRFVNRMARTILGQPPASEGEEQDAAGLLDALDDLAPELAQVLEHAEPVTTEITRRRGEEDICLRVTASPSDRGELVLTFTDISYEQRSMALQSAFIQELAHAEQRRHDFAACASDWLWEMDAQGQVRQLERTHGEGLVRPPEPLRTGQVLANHLDDALGDGATLMQAIAERSSFRSLRCYTRPTNTQPKEVWRLSGVPIWDETGAFCGYRGAAVDITAQQAIEDALAEARHLGVLLTAAIEASPVNLTIADATKPDLPLMFVNDAFVRTTGYSRDEVLGHNCRFLQGPETCRDTTAQMRAAVAKGVGLRVTLLNYRKNGQRFWNALDLAPVRDEHQRLIAYVGVQHDCTEELNRERMERQRQRLEALGQLAGGVAHEINNHLQPALSLPAVIADCLPEAAEEEREYLETIEHHALQARKIVRDILEFSRRETTTDPTINLLQLTNECLDRFARFLPASIFIERDGYLASGTATPHELHAALDATHLYQVLANILANSAYAMNNCGTIHVGVFPAREQDGDAVLLTVKDSGCGMSEETVSRIFEPFYTTKGPSDGSGLGMSVVYGIVQRWGGDITVESALGQGAEFTIKIPLKRGVAKEEGTASSPAPDDDTAPLKAAMEA